MQAHELKNYAFRLEFCEKLMSHEKLQQEQLEMVCARNSDESQNSH